MLGISQTQHLCFLSYVVSRLVCVCVVSVWHESRKGTTNSQEDMRTAVLILEAGAQLS